MPDGPIRFARRVSFTVRPEDVDEFLSVMRGEIGPGVSKENGLRRIYLLRDEKNRNEVVYLTLWNRKEDSEAYRGSERFDANRERVRGFLEAEPAVTLLDVEYHTVSPRLPPPEPTRSKRRKTTGTKSSHRSTAQRRRSR